MADQLTVVDPDTLCDTHSLPTVSSVWIRSHDGVTVTVTGITTINDRLNVRYETSRPNTSSRGVGVATLDHFTREMRQRARCTSVDGSR